MVILGYLCFDFMVTIFRDPLSQRSEELKTDENSPISLCSSTSQVAGKETNTLPVHHPWVPNIWPADRGNLCRIFHHLPWCLRITTAVTQTELTCIDHSRNFSDIFIGNHIIPFITFHCFVLHSASCEIPSSTRIKAAEIFSCQQPGRLPESNKPG